VKTALLIGVVSSYSSFAAENTTQQTQADKTKEVEVAAQKKTDALLEEDDSETERLLVTGSRIRKSEFASASPIQVISGDIQRELGLFDAGKMLQSTNQAAGVQIDNTFGGYVLDNGPGAATVGFRGLGAERTLVLINGRRMAPAGVGGAPTSPDLNLIPGVMIQRVENLLDGASTVYGSDAVAGVANVILRKDVEGFEVQGSYNQPKGDGGEETVLSAMWGKTMDNGFISIGAEYTDRKAQSYAGNPFAKGCEERIYETEDGGIMKRYSGIGPTKNGEDSCDIYPLTNRMYIPSFFGSVYYTPNYTNTGIPNFSETTVPGQYAGLLPTWISADFDGDGEIDGAIVDGDGDGFRDVDFQDPRYAFQQSDYYKSGDYLSRNKRYSVLVNGEYNFQDASDTTFYYEGLYAKRESPIFNPGAQLFEWVPSSNPFNPCNTEGLNGVDCFGVLGFGDAGSFDVLPIINIRGDRDHHDVDVSQYRLVAGFTGNLTIGEDWYYDAYVSYSSSTGNLSTRGISEERLLNSLNTTVVNNDGSITCGNGSDGCVPVNLFADAIYQPGGGTLTQAEYDYLMVDRTMETKVSQTNFVGYVGGTLFHIPWNGNGVNSIFGAEYRRDKIESNPNDVTRDGLLWGYFADKGADGSRSLREAFTEMEFPLVSGVKGVQELTLTASGRWTDESYYDPQTTYNLKAVYRPVEWFTFRGTKGTSYRAPNLRERFLNGTSGFTTVSDPCVVPSDARVSDPLDPNSPEGYDASLDQRDAAVLAACQAAGADPTSLGLATADNGGFNSSYSVEVETGGTTDLKAETSLAKTFGVVIEQPFSEEFDLTFSLTRFNIQVSNSIAEPSSGYSVSQCYSADGNRAFCNRIDRDPSSGKINLVDASFINIGQITSKGFDYNLFYQQDFLLSGKNLGVSLDLQATRMTESIYDVLGTVDDNVGEPDYPKWRGSAHLRLKYDDFSFNWFTRYIGSGAEDDLGEFEEGTLACRGRLNKNGEPLKCRPLGYTDKYVMHNVSLTWEKDNMLVSVGVRNVFNEAPPKVDPNGSWSNTNIPLGVGYDIFGRTPYINFAAKF
jgi:iron complex outermembrane receptor protein